MGGILPLSIKIFYPLWKSTAPGVAQCLNIVRRALRGEHVEVPARIGLWGAIISDAEGLQLPFGRLRPIATSDFSMLPSAALKAIVRHTSDGAETSLLKGGDIVLETSMQYQIAHFDRNGTGPVRANMKLVKDMESAQLGLLLSTDAEVHASPQVLMSWHWILDPFNMGPIRYWRGDFRASFPPAILSQAECEKWLAWTQKVALNRRPSIDIAISRTLRAAGEREDYADSILDAVIALENLFGGRAELTNRISTSIAWLLGRSLSERIDIQKRVKNVYQARSTILHGGAVALPEILRHKSEALDLAVSSLRELLGSRPDLLHTCKSSSERSNRLLLGG